MFARLEKYGNIGTREPDMLNGKHVYDSFSFYGVENRFANCLSYLRFFQTLIDGIDEKYCESKCKFLFLAYILKRKVDEATWK